MVFTKFQASAFPPFSSELSDKPNIYIYIYVWGSRLLGPPPRVGSDSPRQLASRLGSRLASRLGSRLVSRLAFTFFFPEHFRGS